MSGGGKAKNHPGKNHRVSVGGGGGIPLKSITPSIEKLVGVEMPSAPDMTGCITLAGMRKILYYLPYATAL